ncbi:hypothetical protein DERF_000122, partial [Dermatophagoides farinae]
PPHEFKLFKLEWLYTVIPRLTLPSLALIRYNAVQLPYITLHCYIVYEGVMTGKRGKKKKKKLRTRTNEEKKRKKRLMNEQNVNVNEIMFDNIYHHKKYNYYIRLVSVCRRVGVLRSPLVIDKNVVSIGSNIEHLNEHKNNDENKVIFSASFVKLRSNFVSFRLL